MTQLSPTALEEAAKAMEPKAFETFSRGYTQRNYFENCAFLNAEKVVKRANKKATAAITAYLAQAGKEGWVMVPTNATAQMIAAAFPSTDRDVLSSEDLKTGAAAIMILEGPADLGAITGPAVKEAAAMCKDYRTMLAAAQNGGDLPAPPMGK